MSDTSGAMIEEIAAADYGEHIPQYRGELTELVHSRRLPDELTWNPGAVLALTRSQPAAQVASQTNAIVVDTLMRGFLFQ